MNFSANTFIFDNNNMSSAVSKLKQLLDLDIQDNGKKSYHPKQILRGGIITQKARKFNERMIRAGKMTKYIGGDKIYNRATDRFISKPIDRRSGKIKKSFLNKNLVFGDTFAPKKDTLDFRFVAPSTDILEWTGEKILTNNDLLRQIIITNGIQGGYRIIITRDNDKLIDQSFMIDSNFWKDNKTLFQVDSDSMIWNNGLEEGEVVHFIFTKETLLPHQYYEQAYLSGVNHCFLTPILDWAKDCVLTSKAKSTKKKYEAIVNKIIGKISKDKKKRTEKKLGYIETYKAGIPESKIGELCEDLQIAVEIEQPFSNNKLFEYESNKKPLKKFKFINSRMDHVEYNVSSISVDRIYKDFEPTKFETRAEMNDKLEELEEGNELAIYQKDNHGVRSIRTLTDYYTMKNDYAGAVADWEKKTGLRWCSIDALKYPLLQKFINMGTHFNGTIDFEDTSGFKDHIPSSIHHIDMTKAYTQFKKSSFYCGFMGKITDFRKVDNYKENGLYYIYDLDFSKSPEKFIELNNKLVWFEDDNIYTKAELDALESFGVTFKVKYGAMGIRYDFDFNPEMIKTKEVITHNENEFQIAYYAKWCGMNCRINENKSFYMKGKKEYFENLNTEADVYFCNDGEARITYPNKYQYNKKHITAQITAYQRLNMLEQLYEMDLDKIVRICVDGIYFKHHDFKMRDEFSYKTKMTFGNDPCNSYLSNLIGNEWAEDIFQDIAEPRDFYRSELFDSAGGNGKTYYNLIKEMGFINTVYVPHSHKLASAMINQYKNERHDILNVSNHSRILTEPFSTVEGEIFKYNVYIVDECSMLTEHQKEYILEKCFGKVIFCGDLKCQAKPVINIDMMNKLEKKFPDGVPKKFLNQMTSEGFDHIDTKLVNVNYRFKDDKIKKVIDHVRKNINKRIDYKKLGLQLITKDQVDYDKEDIILVSRGANRNITTNLNNEWTEKFKEIKKYKVLDNTRDYKNGDIIFEKVKGIKQELRHGYTIHSVQGETFKHKIFIDLRYMNDNRLFYTAISRANYWKQIYLII